jgi:predicted nucleic acid-binding protein
VAVYYVDSSALVKRHVAEVGSTWMRQLTDPAASHDLFTVTLTAPELIAALARRTRGGHLAASLAAQAIAQFRQDWELQYQPIEPSSAIIARAMDIAEQHGLRGYDAVHAATAIELHANRQAQRLLPLTFISADQDQLRVAAGEGLLIDDPNRHR